MAWDGTSAIAVATSYEGHVSSKLNGISTTSV